MYGLVKLNSTKETLLTETPSGSKRMEEGVCGWKDGGKLMEKSMQPL